MIDNEEAKTWPASLLIAAALLSTAGACDQRHLVIGGPYAAKDATVVQIDAGAPWVDLDAARDARRDELDAQEDGLPALTAQLSFIDRGPVVALMPSCDAGCAPLRVDVAGGTKPYVFAWNDGQTGSSTDVCWRGPPIYTSDAGAILPAVRTVHVTDARGGTGIQLRVESLETCSPGATTVCYACRRLDTICPQQAAAGASVLELGAELPAGANVSADLYLKPRVAGDAGVNISLTVSASQDGCNATQSLEGPTHTLVSDDSPWPALHFNRTLSSPTRFLLVSDPAKATELTRCRLCEDR